MAFWPPELPQSLDLTSYRESAPDIALRTQMDQGPAKIRRRFTAAPTPISGSLTVTKAQRQILLDFFETTVRGGADTFDWLHPVLRTGVVMRFVNPPQIAALSGEHFRAQLSLEIMP